jgi:hypothetical protein
MRPGTAARRRRRGRRLAVGLCRQPPGRRWPGNLDHLRIEIEAGDDKAELVCRANRKVTRSAAHLKHPRACRCLCSDVRRNPLKERAQQDAVAQSIVSTRIADEEAARHASAARGMAVDPDDDGRSGRDPKCDQRPSRTRHGIKILEPSMASMAPSGRPSRRRPYAPILSARSGPPVGQSQRAYSCSVFRPRSLGHPLTHLVHVDPKRTQSPGRLIRWGLPPSRIRPS